MQFSGGIVRRLMVAIGLTVSYAGGAQAALITTSGTEFTDIAITLAMGTQTDAGAGTTTLSYEITLGADPAADWQIVGFTVLREPGEGPFHSTASPDGWSVAAYDDFVHWKVHDAGSGIPEETTLPGFTYTYFGDAPAGQFYRYLVRKDGGTPLQLLSTDVTLLPSAIVPEPGSAALVVVPLATLLYRRRA